MDSLIKGKFVANPEEILIAGTLILNNLIKLLISPGVEKNITPIFLEYFLSFNNSLSEKFCSFGWNVSEIYGNNIKEIIKEMSLLPYKKDMPNMIIANTVKGKGIPSLENKLHSHYEVLTKERYGQIIKELEKVETI